MILPRENRMKVELQVNMWKKIGFAWMRSIFVRCRKWVYTVVWAFYSVCQFILNFKCHALTNMTITDINYPTTIVVNHDQECIENLIQVFKISFEVCNGSIITVSHMHAHICIFILFTYAHLKTRGAAHIHLFKWNEQMQKKDIHDSYMLP